MAAGKKDRQTIEFGDFQTPPKLAREACRLLARCGVQPVSIIEPTCGVGNFLLAALDQFRQTQTAMGMEVNERYATAASMAVASRPYAGKVRIVQSDFFGVDWSGILDSLPEPILIVGNPPWVTSSRLGTIDGSNLPVKGNFQKHRGMDAITGKSNFDISEWMLIRLLDQLKGRTATLAMLCKTTVARKVLRHAWKEKIRLSRSDMFLFDAAKHFGAAVDACFLICQTAPSGHCCDCSLYPSLSAETAEHRIGYRDGQLVADVRLYDRWRHLQGKGSHQWRSGVKHDCAKVMELRVVGARYLNGLGEMSDIEDEYLFPMLKSSDIANCSITQPRRLMLVTQRAVGDDTSAIRRRAPKTWKYLERHAELLDRRGSRIYKDRPRFSMFGVGPYAFAPWKVAISGFYKKLAFKVVGSVNGKPVVLDDTSYFIPCRFKDEAEYLQPLLTTSVATEFFTALVFWDAKRPITAELLRRLDLFSLATELGTESTMKKHLRAASQFHERFASTVHVQRELFINAE